MVPHEPGRFALLFAFALVAACSAAGASRLAPGSGGTNASGSGGANASGASTGPGALTSFTSSSGAGAGGGVAACQAEVHEAQTLPLDMYVMQDQSGSMSATVQGGGTKWQAVTSALGTFVTQPGTAGISIGLQYFAVPQGGGTTCSTTCTTDADCGPSACGPCFSLPLLGGFCVGGAVSSIGGGGDSCADADYATPEVEIAPLPGVASAITSSLAMHTPSTGTPTGPALQGAVDHAKAWALTHPGHVVIAVLSTDGEPDECTPQNQTALAHVAAAALAGTPSVKTFTIGTFAQGDIPSGPSLLDAIAAAGGTGKAFNITTQTQNTNQAFLAALNQIRGSLGCVYTLPVPAAGSDADPSHVNVSYTPGDTGTSAIVPQVPDASACPASGDAWYYDDPAAPTQIVLCGSTCNAVVGDSTGKIEILLGCKTVTTT